VKRAFWLAVLLGACSPPAPPVQSSTPLPLDAISSKPEIVHLLRQLTLPNDEGMHGPYHRAKNDLQEKLWAEVSALPVVANGDHLLFHAIDRVYTRYDRNYWTGHHFHWPYLCSERALRLCDKLLADYPQSTLAERTLYVKAYALRLPATEPDGEAEADRATYALQTKWSPAFDKARAIYRDLMARFPSGRHAKIAKIFAGQGELAITLPFDPDQPDPKNPIPLE
jgi:hypothetical protein